MSVGAGMTGSRSVHQTLIIRLAVAAVCISAALTSFVMFVQFRNIDSRVTGVAASAAERLRWAIMDNLDAPGLGDHSMIASRIEKAVSGRARLPEGHFVFVRILDADFREAARLTDPSYPHIGELDDFIQRGTDRKALKKQGVWNEVTRVGGAAVIHMGHELKNSSNRRAGFVEGVYAISPAFVSRARLSAVVTALTASSIVLLTTLILYPAINRLLRRVSGLSTDLLHANLEIMNVLGSAIAKRDNDTDIHNYRVTIYAIRIAEEMHLGDNEIRTLIKGAFLHDVGKIGISDAILLKPSSLTPGEFEEMKKHVRHGLDIVSRSEWLRDAGLVVGNHHEKYDGTGYLTGSNGDEIPRVARIFAIADVFDALTSKRPYKEAFPYDRTMEILEKGRGSHFDPEILDVFIRIAPSLYEAYANRDDEKPRSDLIRIGGRYYDDVPSLS